MRRAPPSFDDETVDQRGAWLSASTERSVATLAWRDEAGTHQVALTERVTLGSAPGVSVVVHDRAVSRLHAEIEPRDDGLWIRDLGSRNGTFVAGLRIGAAQLPERCEVRVGGTLLQVAPAAAPAKVPLWPAERFGTMLGRSGAMRELFLKLDRTAKSDAAVLVQAETGTGKELVARAIHDASPRAGGPFVVVDCAALPESLLEAELFGHARGAFSGASGAREGAIEAAHGGTVFLDEIGEMPLAMQPKLLRAIESRAVRRIGETHYRAVDVRFVSATHRDLRSMVNARTFREDLFFRLGVLLVTIPPLRARPDDIEPLVQRFAGDALRFDAATLQRLRAAPWAGNVRELRNFVERARALGVTEALASLEPDAQPAGGATLEPRVPPPPPPAPRADARALDAPPTELVVGRDTPALTPDVPFREMRDRWGEFLEREYVRRLLARHGRTVAAAATAAGLDRTYLYKLVRKYGL